MSCRLVVLVSGNGSNLQALLDAAVSGTLDAEVVAVVSNKPDAFGLSRAAKAEIATDVVEHHGKTEARADFDRRLAEAVSVHKPELVVLAGWMRLLTPAFLDRFAVINLHPALPGEFPGTHAIDRAFDAWKDGTTDRSGVMVHWVPDDGVDDGPVIATTEVPFVENDTLELFEKRMHQAEHALLVDAVNLVVAENSLETTGQ